MSTPVLPDWFPRRELSRPTAEQITRADNRKRTLTYAGPNAVIPIVYGEQLVGGPIIAGPAPSGSSTVYAVALCWAGEAGIERIEDCRVGESIVNFGAISNPNTGAQVNNSGIIVRVFDGRQTQPYSTLVSSIPGFDDAFHGVAYAIVSFATANFTSLPQLTFRVKGRRCFDPRGVEWEPLALPFSPNDLVAGSATVIVAAGDAGALATSTNWTTWASRESHFGDSNIYKIGKTGTNVSYLVGEDGKVSSVNATNQATWTAQDSGVDGATIRAASFSLTTTGVLGGDDGVISTSTSNATSWTRRVPELFDGSAIFAAVRSGDQYIVAGESGKVARAASPNIWSLYDSGFEGSTIRCAVHMADETNTPVSDAARVILLGDGGKVSWTADGTTYNLVDAGFGGSSITHAVYAEGRIYALSEDGQIRVSADGEQWDAVPTSGNFRKLFYALGYFVAVDADGQAYRISSREIMGARWTENPVLHMRDFVTNAEFGMGVNLIGAEAAADIADSLYSGIPRSRTGLTIQDSMTEEDALALFAQYAEVLWSYDGRDVVIIPDAPVDTIHEIDASAIIGDSINLTTVGLEQIPTQIRLMFSDREEPTWASRPAVAEMPEHTMHGMPTSPSTVPLPGVFNRLEAERRAYQRLMRLQSPGRLEWQMFAPGMPYQAGDVVRLPNVRGLQSVDVRLTAQPTMVAALKYQMAGEIYSRSHYPSGADGVAVPTGAILILRGTGAVPAGWSLVSIADRLIREGAPGNAGSAMNLSATFQSNIAGAHSGTRDTAARTMPILWPEGTPGLAGPYVYDNEGNAPGPHISGAHRHTFGISKAAHLTVRRRAFRFIKRTGAAGLLPRGVSFLGAESLSSAHVIESPALNTYLAGGSADAALTLDRTISGTVSGGSHLHNGVLKRLIVDTREPYEKYQMAQESGQHSHSIYAEISSELRSVALALFESLGDAALPEGAIVGWDGGAPPPGWALCNGSNGTIDLTERFIYLTASENAGQEHKSESTYSISGTISGSSGSHRHTFTFTQRTQFKNASAPRNPFHDSLEGDHSHYVESVSGNPSGSLDNILRYQLRFIQYVGE